jgi:hypothetical protein
MAVYTVDQIREGEYIEELTGGVTYNFIITTPFYLVGDINPGTSYFTVETIVPPRVPSPPPMNAQGVYSNFTGIDEDSLVLSPYTSGVIIPKDGGQYTFTPANTIAKGSSLVKGTGGIYLTIN